jgi:hypothetical protein
MELRSMALTGSRVAGVALILQLMSGTNPAFGHDHDIDDCELIRVLITPLASDVAGHAEICFGDEGVTGSLRAAHLVPGDAYTVWFSYIDRPQDCQAPGCSAADFGGENPPIAFGRMDSAVAGHRGKLLFSGSVRGLRLSPGSMIWLVLFNHGPASTTDGRFLARQLLTPQDPGLGTPGSGITADGAVGQGRGLAVFQIPQCKRDSLNR